MSRGFQKDDMTPSPLLTAYNALAVRVNRGVARFFETAGFYPEALVYGGYASEDRARIIGRVIMSRRSDQRQWLRERRGWRQFFDAQVPDQPVVIRFGQATLVTLTNDDGYFDVELRGHGLQPGYHEAQVQVLHRVDLKDQAVVRDGRLLAPHPTAVRATRPASARVRVVGRLERFGIVSDIDDTIVVSNMPRPLLAARHAFVEYVSARVAVPGMSEFLRTMGLRGASDAPAGASAPQVYLSTGAWNFVPALRDFVNRGRFPLGTFLMTDFGPSPTSWFRSGPEHKRRELRRLADFFPQIRWLLVGDDGQRDPMIYSEFASEYPQNVAGIAIRSLSTVEQILTHGTPRQLLPDALSAVPESVPVWVEEDGYALLDVVFPSDLSA